MEMPETPELDKLTKINEQGHNTVIGAFLEWAGYNGYHFTKTQTVQAEGLGGTRTKDVEVPVPIEDALAHYFGIDMAKVRAEREAVYVAVRKASACQRGATG